MSYFLFGIPRPQSSYIAIHMCLFPAYGHYFIFGHLHAYILYLIYEHEHVI